jgi:hypothetical protein
VLSRPGQDDHPDLVVGVGLVEETVDPVDERAVWALATSGRFMVMVATCPATS